MPRLIHRILLFASIALAPMPAGPASAQAAADANEIRATARQVLSDSRYQPPPEFRGLRGQSPDGFEAPKDQPQLPDIEATPVPEPAPPPRAPIGKPLLWMMVFIAAVLLAAYLWNEWPRLRGQRRQRQTRPIPMDEANLANAPAAHADDGLATADRLAQQGQYGEAIHALLLHSFDRLHDRLGTLLIPSRTSRELLRGFALDGEAKTALTKLVGIAEHSHFGGRRSDAAEYRDCREDCRRLLEISAGATP